MNETTRTAPRFLLVEDDEDHAALVLRSIRRIARPPLVDRVSDGVEALAFLRGEGSYSERELPDVVLLDINLPKLSGHEVLAEIRADEKLSELPVVVLSTSDTEADRKRAYRNHANSYLVKPLDFHAFRAIVESLGHYWGDCNRPPP